MKRVVILLLTCSLMLLGGACRSRKNVPSPTLPMPPGVTDQAPAPAPTPVPTRADEFETKTPADDDVDTSDMEALNRNAVDRGWIADAFFEYDSNTLSADARAALERSATWLRTQPGVGLAIEGHCDERGTEQYNLALGDRRANAASAYLATLGVDESRLSTISYGEERPFAEGESEAAWAQNRRAHLVLRRLR